MVSATWKPFTRSERPTSRQALRVAAAARSSPDLVCLSAATLVTDCSTRLSRAASGNRLMPMLWYPTRRRTAGLPAGSGGDRSPHNARKIRPINVVNSFTPYAACRCVVPTTQEVTRAGAYPETAQKCTNFRRDHHVTSGPALESVHGLALLWRSECSVQPVLEIELTPPRHHVGEQVPYRRWSPPECGLRVIQSPPRGARRAIQTNLMRGNMAHCFGHSCGLDTAEISPTCLKITGIT